MRSPNRINLLHHTMLRMRMRTDNYSVQHDTSWQTNGDVTFETDYSRSECRQLPRPNTGKVQVLYALQNAVRVQTFRFHVSAISTSGQDRPVMAGLCDSLPWRNETILRCDILQSLAIVFTMQCYDSESPHNIPNIIFRDSGICDPLSAVAFTSYRACCRAQLQETHILLIPLAVITPQQKRTARNKQSQVTTHVGKETFFGLLPSMPSIMQTLPTWI
jgi:hypothetical protein